MPKISFTKLSHPLLSSSPELNNRESVSNPSPSPSVNTANDGSNANTSHYDLPAGATELKHFIWHKNMNAQIGEIFRATWRLGAASHSSKARDLRKIIAYAEQELERMAKYEEQ